MNLDPELIKQLPRRLDWATTNEQLAALKKAILERALGGELIHHQGYEKGEPSRLAARTRSVHDIRIAVVEKSEIARSGAQRGLSGTVSRSGGRGT